MTFRKRHGDVGSKNLIILTTTRVPEDQIWLSGKAREFAKLTVDFAERHGTAEALYECLALLRRRRTRITHLEVNPVMLDALEEVLDIVENPDVILAVPYKEDNGDGSF